MGMRAYGCVLVMAVLALAFPLVAQDIDAIITTENRKAATLADEIRDPAERSAYLALFARNAPEKTLALATDFLQRYPQSAYLALAYELAARATFDLGDAKSGLDYAQRSLVLLPENPLFLVAVADIQAREHRNNAAIASAQDALDYLDRFTRPISIPASTWPGLKRNQQATARFVIGRALLQKALPLPIGPARSTLLDQATSSLSEATALNPADIEFAYLRGEAYLLTNDLPAAAAEFAFVDTQHDQFAPHAREQLKLLYSATGPSPARPLEEFIGNAAKHRTVPSPAVPLAAATLQHHDYAGSDACKACHGGIYRRWDQSGMSKMLQPYQPQKVIGDFEKNNLFYAGDPIAYRHGELQTSPAPDRAPFARMVLRNGRHFFEIKQSDGHWHTYPVDYLIGSKWQQAYATTLPNKQIHVFPIQYSTIENRWVNYWKVIDPAGSARANPYNWEKFDIATNYKANCASCHTSQLRNVKGGGLDADNLVFREPGIGCEMCHGPSVQHIAAVSTGEVYRTAPLDPPVQFDRLGNRDFVSICAQCHLQSNVHEASPSGELNYSSTGTFFLRNAAVPFAEFSRKGFFKDGRFSQTTFMVEALERSQCFRKGNASCGSCHDPHSHNGPANNTSLRFKDDPDRMCVNCHAQFAEKTAAAAHTHHASDSEASRCVSCHMPRIMDALLFRARSHQIDDIPNTEMTLRFGQAESPNACLLCHTGKTAAWAQTALQAWKPVIKASVATN